MRTMGKVAGLCLALMLTMGMALTGNASAEPGWVVCLEGVNSENTKYEDSSCTKAKSTGTWEPLAVGSSDTVTLQALTILFRDTKATGGASGVRCGHPTGGWGLVAESDLLFVRSFKVANPKTECERVEGGCKAGEVEKVEGVDLSWRSELLETEGKFLGKIEADGNGEPGWAVECNTLLGKVTDTCTSEAGEAEQVELSNEVTGGVLLVRAKFQKLHKEKCSQGGAKAGEEVGQFAISLVKGQGLQVVPRRSFFLITGPVGAVEVGKQVLFTVEKVGGVANIAPTRLIAVPVGGFRVVSAMEKNTCATMMYANTGAGSMCTFKVEYFKKEAGQNSIGGGVTGSNNLWTGYTIIGE